MEQSPLSGESRAGPARDPQQAAWEEIDLLTEAMICGGSADHRLTPPEIDAALGLGAGGRVSAA